ncbi:hypothetical protein E1301_Tti020001 [Triplophysa tibetana]|uniref:AIG1-type G domain-containing protein n=1 Tax=Triplophysa tibetana TaxID=1572043 RepID=A0A5A9NAK6_9TELE|nr:hypothetical protein E1301_Tti020001 [Triplophysa tibetana]
MCCVSVSDWRIVLLGKNLSENSRLGNSILGTNVWDSEDPSEHLQNHSVRVSGTVENRHITVINSVNLLQTDLSSSQITDRVKECISLCSPGPHVFILALQRHNFSVQDRNRVKDVLKEFSDQAMKHTIVLTTDEEIYRTKQPSLVMNEEIKHLIQKCGGGHLQFDEGQAAWLSEMFRRIDEIVEKEPDEYLICETYEDAEGSSVNREPKEEDSYFDDGRSEESHKTRSDDGTISSSVSLNSKLNVVLCGADATLKVFMSKLLRGKLKKTLNQKVSISSVCVKKEEKTHGRQICVVNLPALTGLSHEEVMCESFTAVSLCGPGAHVFLIILPVGPLTDEDKGEIEKIQKIFDSTDHFMMIFTSDVTVDRNVTDFVDSYAESQRLIRLCGGRYRVIGLQEHKRYKPASIDLLEYIENMKTEPYSLQMYVRAQEMRGRHETEKYKAELSEMRSKIKELQEKISSCGFACPSTSSEQAEDEASIVSAGLESAALGHSSRDAKALDVLLGAVTNAVNWLKLDWPQEQEANKHSKLDDYLSGDQGDDHKSRALPFFEDLHAKLSRSWQRPHSSSVLVAINVN